jgi:zinc D-Ala-D-Ala carboxypeptidase
MHPGQPDAGQLVEVFGNTLLRRSADCPAPQVDVQRADPPFKERLVQLSRHFTLAEMTHSDTAQQLRLPNQPGPAETENLRALCRAVLDPLREAIGQPIKVNSGYRSSEVNAAIKGATTSQHLHGMAADIQSRGVQVLDLFKRIIRMGLPFDQLIYEAKNAGTKWVHVSHSPAGNRGQIMTATFGPDGRPTGYPRITAEAALAMAEPASKLESLGGEPGYVEMDDAPAPRKRPTAKKMKKPVKRAPGRHAAVPKKKRVVEAARPKTALKPARPRKKPATRPRKSAKSRVRR